MDKVSVVIPAYNEEDYIEKCLVSLSKQSYENIEIIVVDDGSTDKTLSIIKKFENVKLIKGKHKGPGFSRNLGARKSSGKILVFVDADMTFDKDYIKNLVEPMLKDKNILGTTHDYEVAQNTENIWSRLWGKERVVWKSKKRYSDKMVIFRAIRKSIFLKKGGFDPKYGYADDQTFWIKYKMRPYISKNTICYHRNAESLSEVYKQSRWIGASLDPPLINSNMIKYIVPIAMLLFAPISIIYLSIKKAIANKQLRYLHLMIIFMIFRYFGTLEGIYRKAYHGMNVR